MLKERNALFHVVCRDCKFESVEDDRETAERLVGRHERDGHRPSYERIV